MIDVISKIEEFCKVKNEGPAYDNSFKPTPRVRFITKLLEQLGIDYEIDKFFAGDTPMYNVILRGNSSSMVVAHHDIVNPDSDNANDNSASVINAIYLKTLCPETNVVFTDGEECGLWGAKKLASDIRSFKIPNINWVLNLELTGKGGKNIMVGNHKGYLTEFIHRKFRAPIIDTPVSDCFALESAGIQTTVLNPLALLSEGETSNIEGANGFLDNSSWYLCHSLEDSLDKISTRDMREFVEEVLVPIVTAEELIYKV